MMLYLGDSKRCSKCKKYKPLSEFNKQYARVTPRCKQCLNEQRRKYKDYNDRFWKTYWSRVTKVGGCLEWNGWCQGRDKSTPYCSWKGRKVNLRRVVYQLACGDVPEGMFVITTCANKRCVRHSHLRLVTQEEWEAVLCNSAPVGEKNGIAAHPECRAVGERHGQAKLSVSGVRIAREMYSQGGVSIRAIGARFGVSYTTMYDAIHEKHWKHVLPDCNAQNEPSMIQ